MLRLLPAHPDAHEFDLPPLWDGERVEWAEWSENRSSLRWHMKPDECVQCHLDPGDVFANGYRRTPRGRAVFLLAHRCQHCGHDTVTESVTFEHWELDDSDYGPAGSGRP